MRYFSELQLAIDYSNPTNLLFASDVKKIAGNVTKRFFVFKDIEEFEQYIQSQAKAGYGNHFYEIIDGVQRIYLDIDIPISDVTFPADEAITDLIQYIKQTPPYLNTRIHTYTSHRANKLSYHIILADVFAHDQTQCKLRVQELLNDYEDKLQLKPYIDMRVYRRHQHFRLLGASKSGVDNVKVPWENTPNDLAESLISRDHHGNESAVILDYIVTDDMDINYYISKLPKSKSLPAKMDFDYEEYESDDEYEN